MSHDHSLPADSQQLIPGQRFHHRGGNGVTYFSLHVQEIADGSIYPTTKTAPAANAIPVECDEHGAVVACYFLMQGGRPEVGEHSVLKSVGSFCAVDELPVHTSLRSLHDKLGIVAHESDMIPAGISYGYGPQFQFPISLFILKKFTLLENIPTPHCSRVRMTISEIGEAQAKRKFFNSETIDLVATILLRNASRETFGW